MCTTFILDVEATGPVPRAGVMTELGIVAACNRDGFYVRTHDFHEDPEVLPGFRPVVDVDEDGRPVENLGYKVSSGSEPWRGATDMDGFVSCDTPERVGAALERWVRDHAAGGHPVAVSDNPGFDMAFVNDFLFTVDRYGLFGHSARRIGDFAAGLERDWRKASKWKKLKKTPHTHHPIADARGNAEALNILLARQN